jgi:hypothetical protein
MANVSPCKFMNYIIPNRAYETAASYDGLYTWIRINKNSVRKSMVRDTGDFFSPV